MRVVPDVDETVHVVQPKMSDYLPAGTRGESLMIARVLESLPTRAPFLPIEGCLLTDPLAFGGHCLEEVEQFVPVVSRDRMDIDRRSRRSGGRAHSSVPHYASGSPRASSCERSIAA
jgi:hypothetical protein